MIFYLLLFFAYMFGAIPFGLLFGRLFADIDVRQFGSGNIGATNVNRVLGRKLGAATLLCDVLKGLISVLLAKILLGNDDPVAIAWVGMAAFLGHCYPIYLKFDGGKGVATTFGVLAVLSFKACLVGLAAWLIAVKITRISAMGALTASVIIPFAVFYFERSLGVTFIVFAMMLILVFRHRENIRKMRAKTEA
ncbi:MAG: glycerol-3-phosphate 1-O-acyltransferase PlsY [Deltaproteobacteria bacterium]|nr:glycerol-3-phosphate 1-O-acyltransferase PlsY [Deltaproteobacteria bacterium]